MPDFTGEPRLEELQADPILQALMKADGVNVVDFCGMVRHGSATPVHALACDAGHRVHETA